MSQYTEQAENFLKQFGLEFRAVLIGSDCPKFCPDAEREHDMEKVDTFPRKTHIHGKHYRCTISGQGRGHVSFDFWNSYNDEEFNACKKYAPSLIPDSIPLRIPLAYDLLAAIQKSDVGTFRDFCGDFGYDTDSREAESTYRAVVKEWEKVQRFFTETEIHALQQIQ